MRAQAASNSWHRLRLEGVSDSRYPAPTLTTPVCTPDGPVYEVVGKGFQVAGKAFVVWLDVKVHAGGTGYWTEQTASQAACDVLTGLTSQQAARELAALTTTQQAARELVALTTTQQTARELVALTTTQQMARAVPLNELRWRPICQVSQQTDQFLARLPALRSICVEALKRLVRLFPDRTYFALEVERFPDHPAPDDYLFLLVRTGYNPEQALALLDSFDREWWLDALPNIEGRMAVALEYV